MNPKSTILALVPLVVAACSSNPTSPGDSGADSSADAAVEAGPTGCSAAAPTLPLDEARTIDFGGGQRSFRIHVPATYAAGQPTPVVLGFHGDTPAQYGDAAVFFQTTMTNMVAKSDAAGFILVAPEGIIDDPNTGATWNAGSCCAKDKTRDDVGFVRAVVAAVEDGFCVDSKRVYAAGYSSGAFMTYRLACEAADVFAAIAPAAGLTGVTACTPARPVPIIDFAGTADANVPYASVTTNITDWVGRDVCGSTTTTTFTNGDSQCDTYACSQNGEITLCTVQDGGHAWPGGLDVAPYGLGKTTTDLVANDAMWDFFTKHPMP